MVCNASGHCEPPSDGLEHALEAAARTHRPGVLHVNGDKTIVGFSEYHASLPVQDHNMRLHPPARDISKPVQNTPQYAPDHNIKLHPPAR